jgi:hypothetical protein
LKCLEIKTIDFSIDFKMSMYFLFISI